MPRSPSYEDPEQVVGGNGEQAPSFASLYEFCAAVPPHLTLGGNLKMKNGIAITFGIAMLFVLGVSTGFIGIYFPRVIENQSLASPITITKIDGNKMMLEDGRVLELEGPMCFDDWSSALSRNHNQLEVEYGKSGEVTVYGNVRRTICGGTYAIRIPLIRRDENRNTRRTVAFGTDITKNSKAQQAVHGNTH